MQELDTDGQCRRQDNDAQRHNVGYGRILCRTPCGGRKKVVALQSCSKIHRPGAERHVSGHLSDKRPCGREASSGEYHGAGHLRHHGRIPAGGGRIQGRQQFYHKHLQRTGTHTLSRRGRHRSQADNIYQRSREPLRERTLVSRFYRPRDRLSRLCGFGITHRLVYLHGGERQHRRILQHIFLQGAGRRPPLLGTAMGLRHSLQQRLPREGRTGTQHHEELHDGRHRLQRVKSVGEQDVAGSVVPTLRVCTLQETFGGRTRGIHTP